MMVLPERRSYEQIWGEIFDEEGISTQSSLPPFIRKPDRLINASEYLFGFLLSDGDPRWHLVEGYLDAKDRTRFRGLHFECALRAIYLSEWPSYRNRYRSYPNEQNIRQLARAIINLAAFSELSNIMAEVLSGTHEKLTIEFARTNKISLGTDARGITGCPEALYQLRLFRKEKYMGRIGFNVHLEQGKAIFSIVNIQGIPNGKDLYGGITNALGMPPLNYLVGKLRAVCDYGFRDLLVEVRGLRNPQNNPHLYNTIFSKEGIERYPFHKRSTH